MAFDFKKEFKKIYRPLEKPEIIEIPKMNFIAVRGKGNPNEKEGEYQKAVEMLYGVAYTLKMSYRTQYKIEGFFEYVVPPLEGLCVQCMHIGSYNEEPETIQRMNEFAQNNGYNIELTEKKYHHEIYLSDPRKTDINKLKTVIRQPVKK